jgi:serine protease inhibitor
LSIKAVLEVTEEGSEAAAATGMLCCDGIEPEEEQFVADRPFLVFIMDNRVAWDEEDLHVMFAGAFIGR